MLRAITVSATLSALLAAGACSPGPSENSMEASFSDVFRLQDFDFDPVETPAELAEDSSFAVAGRIVDAFDGRAWGYAGSPDLDPRWTVLLALEVDDTFGASRQGVGETLLVEVDVPLGQRGADVAGTIPTQGLPALFYLSQASADVAGDSLEQVEVSDVWPGVADVWQTTNPQGLIVEEGGLLISPLRGSTLEGGRPLAAYQPGGALFDQPSSFGPGGSSVPDGAILDGGVADGSSGRSTG